MEFSVSRWLSLFLYSSIVVLVVPLADAWVCCQIGQRLLLKVSLCGLEDISAALVRLIRVEVSSGNSHGPRLCLFIHKLDFVKADLLAPVGVLILPPLPCGLLPRRSLAPASNKGRQTGPRPQRAHDPGDPRSLRIIAEDFGDGWHAKYNEHTRELRQSPDVSL